MSLLLKDLDLVVSTKGANHFHGSSTVLTPQGEIRIREIGLMQVVYKHCAGLDVHKKTVVACVITPDGQEGWEREIRTFTTIS